VKERNNPPLVSVIIPTYNRAHLVGRAVQSVLDQTFQDFEVIVVDDASTDNTEDVVNGFDDRRIQCVRLDRNSGAAHARNTGAQRATGEYLAFLDSDDTWYPELLAQQVVALTHAPPEVGMVCCGMLRISQGLTSEVRPRTLGTQFQDHLVRGAGICTSAFLVRRSAFENVGGFHTALKSFQDFDFLLRMTSRYRLETVNDILLEYRLEEDSISLNMGAKAAGLRCVLERYEDRILEAGVWYMYMFKLGQYSFLSGQRLQGWLCWAKALRSRPWHLQTWKHLGLSLGGVRTYTRFLELHRQRVLRQRAKPKVKEDLETE